MSKHKIIKAIRQHNRSATEEFLALFDEQALQSYLRRLTTLLGHRGRDSVWVRQGDTPAVVTRLPTA